jgi:hypothetical protein
VARAPDLLEVDRSRASAIGEGAELRELEEREAGLLELLAEWKKARGYL